MTSKGELIIGLPKGESAETIRDIWRNDMTVFFTCIPDNVLKTRSIPDSHIVSTGDVFVTDGKAYDVIGTVTMERGLVALLSRSDS